MSLLEVNHRTTGNITASAAGRLNVVQARIDELRRRPVLNLAAAEEYEALLDEHGRLDLILVEWRGD